MENELFSLNQNKNRYFDVHMDFLTLCTWIYKIEQYLILFQSMNQVLQLLDANKIVFPTILPPLTAAFWWNILIQRNAAPTSFVEFEGMVHNEIVP